MSLKQLKEQMSFAVRANSDCLQGKLETKDVMSSKPV